MIFRPTFTIVLTIAEAKVVFPVPAEPRMIIADIGSRLRRKRANTSIAAACSRVGSTDIFCLI